MPQALRPDAKLVVAAFLGSGTLHLARPEIWEPMMPAAVPAHREVILGSGVAEIVCAAGMIFPPTRRLAGYASAALLTVVYAGNVKVALDASRSRKPAVKAMAYGRLPLQLPLIWAAWKTGRRG